MKTKIISTSEIEVLVASYYGTRTHLIIPNVSWGFLEHEADLFIINKANYCTEVEIKISVSDFKADLKKGHDHSDRRNRIKYLYYAMPWYIADKVRDLIPENAGLIEIKQSSYGDSYFSKIKEAKANKHCRPITDKELLTLQRLALIRLWKYKGEIIKLKDQYRDNSRLL